MGDHVSRRDFLMVGASTAGLVLIGSVAGERFVVPAEAVPIAGGTLDPTSVGQFVTPLLVPPVMPRAGTGKTRGGKPVDLYEVSVRQFNQQVLPAGLPATTVWGYGPTRAASRNAMLVHNAPSLTIEAQVGRPVQVRWVNELKDETGRFRPHLLPVDPTLHWANPPGGVDGRDTRPTFTSTPERYTGPVPLVTHVHGAAGVGDESDGYAEAWFLPDAVDIPDGYATTGRWYDFFADKAATRHGVSWAPGSAIAQYPNGPNDRASVKWYHDHTLGMTRLNVYAGPAGFYLLRGGPSGDSAVVDTRTGLRAVLPGPAPREGDKFPSNKTYFEIPLAIQDWSFNADGSLFYPDTRAFFDGVTGPFLPETDVSPIWNPEFFGNTIMVNGNTWPFLGVQQRRYRFRVLNGCQSRFLILDFGAIPGVEVWKLGNEGGFLDRPVDLTTTNGNRMLLAPAERADIIVDLTAVPPGSYVVGNVGPDEPFGGGVPGVDFVVADPATTGRVLQLRVTPALAPDPSTPPRFLRLPAITPLPAERRTRPLALLEAMSAQFPDSPSETLLGNVAGDPNTASSTVTPTKWMEPVTENPAVGDTEVWEFYNTTGDAHPMHVHEVLFQVVNRQTITIDEATAQVVVDPASTAIPPEPWEKGFKDTVIAYPGQVTRIRARFNTPGQYVWHCHIVEHEDNEMMRPYRVGPAQPGEPVVPTHDHAGEPIPLHTDGHRG